MSSTFFCLWTRFFSFILKVWRNIFFSIKSYLHGQNKPHVITIVFTCRQIQAANFLFRIFASIFMKEVCLHFCFFQLSHFVTAAMLVSLKLLGRIVLLFLFSENFYRIGIISSLTVRKSSLVMSSRLQAFVVERFLNLDSIFPIIFLLLVLGFPI